MRRVLLGANTRCSSQQPSSYGGYCKCCKHKAKLHVYFSHEPGNVYDSVFSRTAPAQILGVGPGLASLWSFSVHVKAGSIAPKYRVIA
jgi:hypothetical protein